MRVFDLKKAGAADVLQLQDISTQTFIEAFADSNTAADMKAYLEQSFSYSQLMKEILDPLTAFYFAVRGGEILGYMKLNTGGAQKEQVDSGGMELERIYVLRTYLGEGVGQILLDQALLFAKASRARFIWLGVWEKNARAIRFYQKNGFQEFGTHPFQLGQDIQTDILMRRPVSYDVNSSHH